MHLLFVLFTFSLIFEIVIAICVVLFCNSPFLCFKQKTAYEMIW